MLASIFMSARAVKRGQSRLWVIAVFFVVMARSNARQYNKALLVAAK